MKKGFLVLVMSCIVACMLALVGCSAQSQQTAPADDKAQSSTDAQKPSKVTIKSLNGAKELVDLEVPYEPQRIAVLDLASLDIIDNIGKGDKVVASAQTKIDYLQKYMDTSKVANVGTIKEPDMEALMAAQPDVIFIGGRLAKKYDELSKIAPVVYLAVDSTKGVFESTKENAKTIESMFDADDVVEAKMADFQKRIDALKSKANGASAVVGLCTSGSFNILGKDGRCSLVSNEVGFKNLADGQVTSTHGNESSFETLAKLNPEWIFVLDRDAAINAKGAKLAKEILDNELVNSTNAAKNQKVVIFSHPAIWYTAEGGLTAFDIMLKDVEEFVK